MALFEGIDWSNPFIVAIVSGILVLFGVAGSSAITWFQHSQELRDRLRWRKLEAYADHVSTYSWVTDQVINIAGESGNAATATSERLRTEVANSERALYRTETLVKLLAPPHIASYLRPISIKLPNPFKSAVETDAFKRERDEALEELLKRMRKDLDIDGPPRS